MPENLFKGAITRSLNASVPTSNYQLDCFVTNEVAYNDVLSRCMPARGTTGAFLGVGPCQNLTYIGALRPRLAIIADARIENLLVHLMYKLLIERAEAPLSCLGLLLSREVPPVPPATPTPESLVAAVEGLPISHECYLRNLAWLQREMGRRWGLTLQYQDRFESLYTEFYKRQLDITNVSESTAANLNTKVCLRDIIVARNSFGVNMHFLTAANRYDYVRELHAAHRIIPILGNLTSPPTIRAINEIVSEAGEKIATAYISNIEEHALLRYRIVDDFVAQQLNPQGLLDGEFGVGYRSMVDTLAELETEDDALLIRFFFPGEYRGRMIGSWPGLQPDVRSVARFVRQVREDNPPSVFDTYF